MRTLLHYPLQPSSRKVRLILAEKKLGFDLRIERSWEAGEELLRMNPAGDTPVLIDENDLVVTGDPGIAEYIEEVYSSPPLISHDLEGRVEIRRLCAWFDQKFNGECVWPLLNEKVYRRLMMMGGPDSIVIRQAQSRLHHHLSYIGWLSENHAWLAGNQFSLADISAGASLSCLDYLGDIPWEKYPTARQFYAKIKSRPTFRALLADKIPGIPPSAHYQNLDF